MNPAMVTIAGIAASRGFAAGPVYVHRPDSSFAVPEYEIPPDHVLAELARYHAARAQTRQQIEALIAQLREDDRAGADIFTNHLAMLDDSTTTAAVERQVREERINVETAIRRTVAEYVRPSDGCAIRTFASACATSTMSSAVSCESFSD